MPPVSQELRCQSAQSNAPFFLKLRQPNDRWPANLTDQLRVRSSGTSWLRHSRMDEWARPWRLVAILRRPQFTNPAFQAPWEGAQREFVRSRIASPGSCRWRRRKRKCLAIPALVSAIQSEFAYHPLNQWKRRSKQGPLQSTGRRQSSEATVPAKAEAHIREKCLRTTQTG
jgi:hypothetical protein